MFFLIFWAPIFSRPKKVTDVKNSLYYGGAMHTFFIAVAK